MAEARCAALSLSWCAEVLIIVLTTTNTLGVCKFKLTFSGISVNYAFFFFLVSKERNYCLMVIGVPNVGKSSFINALRRTNLKKGIRYAQ